MSCPRKAATSRTGFSLLEVILSLAILSGAIAVLGEAARMGIRNSVTARYLTQAQLLCESKLAEITSGILEPNPVSAARFDRTYTNSITSAISSNEWQDWQYSIAVNDLNQDGLVAVCVTVEQVLPANKHPVTFQLTRWIPDPGVELAEESGQSEESTAEGSSSQSPSGGGGNE
jgi:prepilin-type N-terminal cleavage/methylation domain-containing protein